MADVRQADRARDRVAAKPGDSCSLTLSFGYIALILGLRRYYSFQSDRHAEVLQGIQGDIFEKIPWGHPTLYNLEIRGVFTPG